ncbi:hypothetical protein LMG33818_001500 [Halomonadaceae bacterium LMG 33818]|uniref:DUF4202 domain-containing protein n=1 Tax=Cernens ardua TaxID=3402176 RepID=UPI003EDC1C32
MADSRYIKALELIDAAHADDPRKIMVDQNTPSASDTSASVNPEGPVLVERPYELVYAERMSEWLDLVAPEAPIPLKLAVRAQHLRRWETPRESYPMDKAGYHAWRTGLKKRQADLARQLIIEAGFEASVADRVAALIRKENLKEDKDTQALEDTTCLVFLGYYLDDFSKKYKNDDDLVRIIAKTWKKMSTRGQTLTTELDLSDHTKSLVERALSE